LTTGHKKVYNIEEVGGLVTAFFSLVTLGLIA